MFSELVQAEIVNGAVLIATLESDLGAHRKIGPTRLLRPALIAGGIVPRFIGPVATHGTGLAVELAGAAAGAAGGLAAVALTRVYRSPRTGKPVSHATWPYALLWTLVVGARAAFSYGATHWFPAQIAQWCLAHQVTGAAITDGLIFMAVAMILTRTLGLGARAAALPLPADGRHCQRPLHRPHIRPLTRPACGPRQAGLSIHPDREPRSRPRVPGPPPVVHRELHSCDFPWPVHVRPPRRVGVAGEPDERRLADLALEPGGDVGHPHGPRRGLGLPQDRDEVVAALPAVPDPRAEHPHIQAGSQPRGEQAVGQPAAASS